jgi:hypothetical protein
MGLLTICGAWRGLGGFSHLAQYTAVWNAPGPSNWRVVTNRFDGFKFSALRGKKKGVGPAKR